MVAVKRFFDPAAIEESADRGSFENTTYALLYPANEMPVGRGFICHGKDGQYRHYGPACAGGVSRENLLAGLPDFRYNSSKSTACEEHTL